MSANNFQVAGSHYKSKYQHWDFVADVQLGYFEGQITKYLTRWQKKGGLEDVQKAKHYLLKLVELAQFECAFPVQHSLPRPLGTPKLKQPSERFRDLAHFASVHSLGDSEREIFRLLILWMVTASEATLREADTHMDLLLEEAKTFEARRVTLGTSSVAVNRPD